MVSGPEPRGAVEPLPPISASKGVAPIPAPPVSRPSSGARPLSGGRRSQGGDSPEDVEALASEVHQLELELEKVQRRRTAPHAPGSRPPSGGRPPSAGRTHAPDGPANGKFSELLAEVRKQSQEAMDAMTSAGAQKGSLEEQVEQLSKQLKQVTIDEMSIVEQLSKELKENVELKAALAKCEEELAIQRALNDDELSMVDELASMEEERNRLRVDVEKLRAAAAPLQEAITDLEQDKIELAQLLGKSEERINVLAERLQGGAELFENKEKELLAFEAETAEKLRFLDKKIASLETDLSSTQTDLASTQSKLAETSQTLDVTTKTAAADAASAAARYADIKTQYENVRDIVASTKETAEKEVAHARSDRTIIVKELRRLQETERETREINAIREAETLQFRKRMEEAQSVMEEATKAEAVAQGQLQDAREEATRERDRSAAMEGEIARVNEQVDQRHLALDAQHSAMNARMEEMEQTMAENLREVRAREEVANTRVREVDERIDEVRVNLVDKANECTRLEDALKALEEGSSKAWAELVEKHEHDMHDEREASLKRLAAELEEQELQLTTMWQKRLADEVELHRITTENLAEERQMLADSVAQGKKISEQLESTRAKLSHTQSGWDTAKGRVAHLESELAAASELLAARKTELLECRENIVNLEAATAARDLQIAGQEEEKSKLREEVQYMEEKLVSARTDKLDAVADMQVRNVLLEKELVVRNEQAGLNGEAKVRLQRDQDRQRQRVAEMGRTIDFLRSDVRRLDEERIELRETYRKDMQRLTSERDAYMDEVDRMAFVMTERNATSEEVLSRAKGEGQGLNNKLDMARGLFDSILTKLENPGSDATDVSVTMNPLGGILGAAGGAGPGSVRVSVDVRDVQNKPDEFDSDDDVDGEEPAIGAGTSTSFMESTMPAAMPKTEELLEGVTTDQWNRRKERRAARKREVERLRRQLRESDAERGVLTRALQDMTRNLAQLRFTGEAPDALAPPQFVMEGGVAMKPKAAAQPGIAGAAAAGSRRNSSRASNRSGSHTDRADSRADSRASLVDAAAGARAAGRAPPPTHFNYGPSLPPPLQEQADGGSDSTLVPAGAVGAVQDAVEVSKEPPSLDEIFDYAAYLGLDTALDNELLWIAEEALCCPLPPGWTEHTDAEGNVYFHHAVDNVSTYEHPMDSQYKALAARAKADKSEAAIGALREEILEMKKMSFIPGVAANMAENEAEPEGEV